MVYVLCATQLLTLAALLFGGKWVLTYLERQRSDEARVQAMMADDFAKMLADVLREERAARDQLIDQAYREREQLLNRIQAPAIAVTQVPDAPDPGVSYVDEERERELDFPEIEEEVAGTNGSPQATSTE